MLLRPSTSSEPMPSGRLEASVVSAAVFGDAEVEPVVVALMRHARGEEVVGGEHDQHFARIQRDE